MDAVNLLVSLSQAVDGVRAADREEEACQRHSVVLAILAQHSCDQPIYLWWLDQATRNVIDRTTSYLLGEMS